MSNCEYACPFCGKMLVYGEQKRYETIVEHVDDPNRHDFPLRETLVCNCNDSKNSFWEPVMGAFYSGNVSIDPSNPHDAIRLR